MKDEDIEYGRRLLEFLKGGLGPEVVKLLGERDVEEIYVNSDLRVRVIRSDGREATDVVLSESGMENFLNAVSSAAGGDFDRGTPVLAAVLPEELEKCRVQAFQPPLSRGPAFILRKPPTRVFTLTEYVDAGILSKEGKKVIEKLVRKRKNVMVAGATASGKTTLCNAIIDEIARQFPQDRLVILEDTPELRCTSEDVLRLQSNEKHTMRALVKYSLRCRPDRIIVGEVRDSAAKDLLDAWVTGHSGGCGTVHGEDPEKALERLSDLARQGSGDVDQRRMVVSAVDYLVHIAGQGHQRKVRSICEVRGVRKGRFDLKKCGV